jgi:hypothetical protein
VDNPQGPWSLGVKTIYLELELELWDLNSKLHSTDRPSASKKLMVLRSKIDGIRAFHRSCTGHAIKRLMTAAIKAPMKTRPINLLNAFMGTSEI